MKQNTFDTLGIIGLIVCMFLLVLLCVRVIVVQDEQYTSREYCIDNYNTSHFEYDKYFGYSCIVPNRTTLELDRYLFDAKLLHMECEEMPIWDLTKWKSDCHRLSDNTGSTKQ